MKRIIYLSPALAALFIGKQKTMMTMVLLKLNDIVEVEGVGEWPRPGSCYGAINENRLLFIRFDNLNTVVLTIDDQNAIWHRNADGTSGRRCPPSICIETLWCPLIRSPLWIAAAGFFVWFEFDLNPRCALWLWPRMWVCVWLCVCLRVRCLRASGAGAGGAGAIGNSIALAVRPHSARSVGGIFVCACDSNINGGARWLRHEVTCVVQKA